MTNRACWIRREGLEQTRLWFPYDAALVDQFKALIPSSQRAWVAMGDEEARMEGPHWRVYGPLWCAKAEAWFAANCGRGKEITRGQTELAL